MRLQGEDMIFFERTQGIPWLIRKHFPLRPPWRTSGMNLTIRTTTGHSSTTLGTVLESTKMVHLVLVCMRHVIGTAGRTEAWYAFLCSVSFSDIEHPLGRSWTNVPIRSWPCRRL